MIESLIAQFFQLLILLLAFAVAGLFIAYALLFLILKKAGRLPDISRGEKSYVSEWAKIGFVVCIFADLLLILWWQLAIL